MNFDDLRKANNLRLPQYKNRRGQLSTCEDWTIAEWTNAMAGEVGEACNISKKIRRGDFEDEQHAIDMLMDEIADAVIYADSVAAKVGRNLGQAIRRKFNEDSDKIGVNVKL